MLALSLYLPLMAGQLSLASPGFYALGGYIAADHVDQASSPAADGAASRSRSCSLEMVARGAGLGRAGGPRGHARAAPARHLPGAGHDRVCRDSARALAQPGDHRRRGRHLWHPAALRDAARVSVGRRAAAADQHVLRLPAGAHPRRARLFAIREDELAADAMGINPTHYKVLAFTLGAMLAGVSARSARTSSTPGTRARARSTPASAYLAFVLIGGSRTFVGPWSAAWC